MKQFFGLIYATLVFFLMNSCRESVSQTSKKISLKNESVFPKVPAKNTSTKKLQPAATDMFEIGDINNDSLADTAYVYTPSVSWGGDSNCYNVIRFSAAIPELRHDHSVWGSIESVGDLDKDGVAELLFCPGWFQSNDFTVYLYTLKEGKWTNIAKAHSRRDVIHTLKKKIVFINGYYYLRAIEFDVESDEGFRYYPVKIPLQIPPENRNNKQSEPE